MWCLLLRPALWKMAAGQLQRAPKWHWDVGRGGSELGEDRGYSLLALVSFNSLGHKCGSLCVVVKSAVWHGFVGFKCWVPHMAAAWAEVGRPWQAWV